MTRSFLPRGIRAAGALALALVGFVPLLAAGEPDPPPSTTSEATEETADSDPHAGHIAEKVLSSSVDEIVVTASPLRRTASQVAQPLSILDGTALVQRRQPTLGETLKSLPGVTSTYYGPGASRPIIRGLGGDRVRILENGLVTLDASAASDDHAVTIDPLSVERVEVLRGPSALRYGPNAVGGVVNTFDGRVPSQRRDGMLAGSVELRGASVNDQFAGAAVIDGGYGPLAYRFTGFGLTAGDVDIPGAARSARLRRAEPRPTSDEARDTLPNSAVDTSGFSAGMSWVGDRFYLGAAPSLFRTDYGVVSEEDVTIDLAQNRLDLAGAVFDPTDFLLSIDGRMRLVDYHHTELEGAEVGTRFENQGYDLRLEAVHRRLGLMDGAFGVQSYRADFTANGDEAFLPPTLTRAQSFFVIEDVDLDPFTIQAGARFDYTSVESEGGPRFGSARDRSFANVSGALGLVYALAHEHFASLNVAYTERPPNLEELFANGPHIALFRYEIGDPDLDTERSVGLNLGYDKPEGRVVWSVNGFYNRFWDFITLMPTGRVRDELSVEVFRAVPAHFAGGEVEVGWHLIDGPIHRLHLIGRTDYTWAENRDSGDELPRIPPLRFGGSVLYGWDRFEAQLDVMRALDQRRVPDDTFPTDGYTMLDLDLAYTFAPVGPTTPMLFLRASNLLDEEARDATSFLKDLAPMPGRNVTGGVRVTF